jgi:hypothetical protein
MRSEHHQTNEKCHYKEMTALSYTIKIVEQLSDPKKTNLGLINLSTTTLISATKRSKELCAFI